MRRIGSGFRFCWSPFSLTGEKIRACRQNSDLQAANSEELCVLLKRKKARLYKNYFSELLFEMDFGNQRYEPSLSDSDSIWGRAEMEMPRSVLVPQGFRLFPPSSFKLLFLLSATCSYGNLLHYVSISLHLREISWQESSYVALQQDNSITTRYNTHFPAGIWKHFCSLEAA